VPLPIASGRPGQSVAVSRTNSLGKGALAVRRPAEYSTPSIRPRWHAIRKVARSNTYAADRYIGGRATNMRSMPTGQTHSTGNCLACCGAVRQIGRSLPGWRRSVAFPGRAFTLIPLLKLKEHGDYPFLQRSLERRPFPSDITRSGASLRDRTPFRKAVSIWFAR
jgi:hypothetical protein